MRIFLLAVCAILFISACKKEKTQVTLNGVYTEQSPTNGRSQLNFISDKLVVKSEPSNDFRDTFYYSITANKIMLKHTALQNAGTTLEFKDIDAKSFQIENLYAYIPEAPITYMIYKKQ